VDVRCEKCQTVYEFDDAKVTTAGVTVKCTQCGNLFKVRRRGSTTANQAQAQAAPPPPRPTPGPGVLPPERQRTTTMPRGSAAMAATVQAPLPPPRSPTPPRGVPAANATQAPTTTDEKVWLVRLAGSGEVKRFRELTTLQQWIVEKRVSRDDEISRSGDTWKRLGGIAELASFFHVVEQAQQQQRAYSPTMPATQDEAFSNTAPMTQPVPPPRPQQSPVAFSGPVMNVPQRGQYPPSGSFPVGPDHSVHFEGDEAAAGLDDERPARSGLKPGMLIAIGSAALVVIAGSLVIWKRAAIFGGKEEVRGGEAYRKGRELLSFDSDDQLRLAEQELLKARGADETSPLPAAALAELNARWGGYLRDDARVAETLKQPAKADELRKLATTHVDDAKRYANEAITLGAEDPDANRAMAAFLLVDGAPAAQVEGYLKRCDDKRPGGDDDSAFVHGWLYVRDRRLGDAQQMLDRANKFHQVSTHSDLIPADMMLAEVAFDQGRTEDARAFAKKVIEANARHDRARALLSRLDAPAAPPDAGAAAPPTVAVVPTPQPNTPPAVAPKKPNPDEEDDAPRSNFDALLNQGNKLLEKGGRTKEAQKIFEKALQLQPSNVEALNGLGYCYLDSEHFGGAIDTFKKSLNGSPSNGDAILGIAEAYKMQGNKSRALDFYKKYVSDLPNGSKIRMAQTNVSELEQAIKKADAPTANEVHDAPPLPPPPP
jgi:predicted Zn finger-like uncharacterized protein